MINSNTMCRRAAAGILLSGSILAAISCSPNKDTETAQAPPALDGRASQADGAKRKVLTVEGEAGGVVEDSFTASAKVAAIDSKTRKITLEGEDGRLSTFNAPPEVRNFDQIKIGDRIQATIAQRVTVIVSDSATAGDAHSASLTRSPVGAKPGAMYAESFEAVATVDSIDTVNRKAKLRFADDDTYTVPIREDVDLAKYKAGDHVTIRVTERLTVLVENP